MQRVRTRLGVSAALGALATALPTMMACRDSNSSVAAPQTAQASESEGNGHGHEEHGAEIKFTADAIERYGIKIETAALHKLQPTFTAPARVGFNAEATAHVGTPLPGRIVELRARLGDKVKKGDPLLVVESPELGEAQSEFLGKQIAAKTAISAVELAKNALDRAQRLYDKDRGIALDEVQRREGEHKAAQATLLTAQAAATAAENKLHLLGMDQARVDKLRETSEVNPRFTIIAPIDGQVVQREVTLGELVSREKEALLVLADVGTLWVLVEVPEARLPEISVGTKTWIHAGSIDPHKHEGQVAYIAPHVDPRTRTTSARVPIKCDDGSLRPGVFVEAELAATDRANPDPPAVVAVPDEAVQTLEGKTVVFVPVAKEENTFSQRAVAVGKPIGGKVRVISGLTQDEKFVSAGSFLMKAEFGKGAVEHD